MNVIYTEDLNFQFGNVPIIKGLKLEVPQNSIYGFLGPNGAGKSTSIKLILGLLRPASGQIRIFDQMMQDNKMAILSRIGNMIESPSLYQHLTAWDNLHYLDILFKKGKRRMEEVLDLVGLTHAKKKKVKHFSMGMKQRLGIAMALFHDPDLLILDEPVNGLDPAGIQEMRKLFNRLQEMGKTVFISSHLLAEIEKTCTHLGIIQKGELLYQGEINSLLETATRSIQLKVSSAEDAANAIIPMQLEFNVIDQNSIKVQIPSDEAFDQLIRKMVLENIAVYDVERQTASLEDLFIGLTASPKNQLA
ncbi:MAG: ATP-binding cassette domain-containing protein [Bacteroidota bacterium]